MRRKGMSKGMRTYGFSNSSFFSQTLHDSKNHCTRQWFSVLIKKNSIFCQRVNFLMHTDFLPINIDVFFRGWPNGNQSLFVAFPRYLYKTFVKKEIRDFKVCEFGNAKAAAI